MGRRLGHRKKKPSAKKKLPWREREKYVGQRSEKKHFMAGKINIYSGYWNYSLLENDYF